MTRIKFQELVNTELGRLFQAARARDELAFLFAVLGINSGMEETGWQPIGDSARRRTSGSTPRLGKIPAAAIQPGIGARRLTAARTSSAPPRTSPRRRPRTGSRTRSDPAPRR